jgi:hypothetical protein
MFAFAWAQEISYSAFMTRAAACALQRRLRCEQGTAGCLWAFLKKPKVFQTQKLRTMHAM